MKRKYRRHKNPVSFTGSGILSLAILAAGSIVLYLIYKNRAKLATAFDPTSTENIFYKAAGSVTQAVTGDTQASFGTKIADIFKSDAEKAADVMLAPMTDYPKIINAPGAPTMVIDYPGATPRPYGIYTGGH